MILVNDIRKFELSFEEDKFKLTVTNLQIKEELFNFSTHSLVVLEHMLEQWHDDKEITNQLWEWANAEYIKRQQSSSPDSM